MSLEIVYVLTNPAMPGLVKIGRTTKEDVNQRLGQLYSVGVPFPFNLAFGCKVADSETVERALHRAFAPHRVNAKREFFQIDAEQAIAILKLLHVEDATSELEKGQSEILADDLTAGRKYSAKRPPMNFKEMGIPIGSILNFTENDTTVRVCSDKKVLLGDEEMSLTAATRLLLGLDYSVQPSPYWTFAGQSLRAIYDETYVLES